MQRRRLPRRRRRSVDGGLRLRVRHADDKHAYGERLQDHRRQVPGDPDVRQGYPRDGIIITTIRNISTGAIGDVLFSRFFDADITDRYNYSGATKASAFIWDKSSADPGRGLELSGRTYTFPRSAHILWIANVDLIDACFPGPTSDNLGTVNDWTGRVIYTIGTIAAGASKIIKFVYRVM